MQRIFIGSRGSALALRQTEMVAHQLQQIHQHLIIEVKTIHTQGDKILDVALSKIGDKGLFTKELEQALLSGEIDLAVHSMKDVPTELPLGLTIGAVLARENNCDVLVAAAGKKLAELPKGAVIGTSSLRRRAQLLALRPDLKIVDLRGNLETRVRKMQELNLDGIVLAWAGLARMDMTHLITEIFAPEDMLSAAGQGALAIEIREDDNAIKQLIAELESPVARIEVAAERAFLGGLGGGCQVPIGAWAQVRDGQVHMTGVVATLDGSDLIKVAGSMPSNQAEQLGQELARQTLAQGGQQILAAIPRD